MEIDMEMEITPYLSYCKIEMAEKMAQTDKWRIDGISLSCLVGRFDVNVCGVFWQNTQQALYSLA